MAHGLHSTHVVRDASTAATRFVGSRRSARRRGAISQRNRRAFTLVELAVVVVIVGILAMLAVVSYRKLIGSSHTALLRPRELLRTQQPTRVASWVTQD